MPPLALVTGASGFVGSHLVTALLERGWRVRALVRPTSSLTWLPLDRVELARGTMTDSASLAEAVRGVDLVLHSAGVLRGEHESDYDRVNVDGTRNLVGAFAAHAPAVGRLVLVSSLAAGGPSRPERPRREADPEEPISAYGRSKLRGERELVRISGTLPWTVVRPAAIYGPRDRGFLLLARLAARGWIPQIAGRTRPMSVLHVRDLARGILLAAASPTAAGRTYYLGHPEPTDWSEIGGLMARALGKGTRTLPVPRRAIAAIGGIAGGIAAIRRRPNPLPGDRLGDLLAEAWTCDTSRAQGDLGYTPEVGLEEGISETMSWYRGEGWL